MTVRFEISSEFPQILVIDLEGDVVANLEGNVSRGSAAEIPNVFTLFIKAINLGMFAGPQIAPSECAAKLLERGAVVDGRKQRYRMALRRCDPGALRVLGNLILGLGLTGHVFNDPVARGPRLDPFSLDYPSVPRKLPFPFEFDATGTQVSLEFVNAPTNHEAERVIADLEVWSLLVAACAYAPGERIGGMPDGALLFDSHTVTEGFSELFQSDWAAFHAVASYALALQEAGYPIARARVD